MLHMLTGEGDVCTKGCAELMLLALCLNVFYAAMCLVLLSAGVV
jgi:hypothetical protein